MSSLQAVRIRSQRSAASAAAVERARLTFVQARPTRARRAPFAVLVFLILGAGVVGLLMFNTQMQQASIYATSLQERAEALEAKSQALSLALERKRDPQNLAAEARRLGMVSPQVPAFVDLRNRRVVGTPTVATSADGTRVTPYKARKPAILNDTPITRFVTAKPKPTPPEQSAGATGSASTTNTTATGTNKTRNKPSQGAPR